MKYIIIILSLILSLNISATEIPLKEAIQNKLVECTITGNPNGTHYSKPLVMKIKNLKGDITIKVDNGLILNASDTNYQDIVITNALMAAIPAGQSKTYVVQGMCIKEHASAPSETMKYNPGKMADEKLNKLTLFIQDKKYFNQTAQQAVWAMRGTRKIDQIHGYKSDGWEEIVKYTASLLNVPVPQLPAEDDYERNYEARPVNHVVSGGFEIDWPKKCHATVGLFNKRGIIVRELYNNPNHPAGPSKIKFEFDASLYTDPAYDFKMIIDGEVFLEKEIKLKGRD